jgi:hypothetical protein
MMELVDMLDLESNAFSVRVQIPLSRFFLNLIDFIYMFVFFYFLLSIKFIFKLFI